jgi:hypothetical protein
MVRSQFEALEHTLAGSIPTGSTRFLFDGASVGRLPVGRDRVSMHRGASEDVAYLRLRFL